MNSENFTQWFTEQLLVHMPCGSLMVMDKAPYHTELAEDAFPTPKTRKAPLRQWLPTYHPQVYREDMLKPELYDSPFAHIFVGFLNLYPTGLMVRSNFFWKNEFISHFDDKNIHFFGFLSHFLA